MGPIGLEWASELPFIRCVAQPSAFLAGWGRTVSYCMLDCSSGGFLSWRPLTICCSWCVGALPDSLGVLRFRTVFLAVAHFALEGRLVAIAGYGAMHKRMSVFRAGRRALGRYR